MLFQVLIDGFSSGSVKVFFKVILDRAKLPGRTAEDPVQAAKDVFIQEVMSLEDNAFEDSTIDLDSIGMASNMMLKALLLYILSENHDICTAIYLT